ncbi:MAG: sulfate adenylyltransferase [Bacteroidetes bacterium GWE2_41_25]|nr:MAG: sulfate adenylyltransferase [Bacteroidetes bacterium GWA2_40_15]OFX92551.1 MAG: sulfate adenylyltransferase [Bacteroidetes bacterium GWC2_40_22]OFY11952.1 MAG: sulfate adenylyltransferase [Bacteroidetes bacterium GWE2_41_25]OFY56758.1 MAG: sulfate adenylyltransferase [Bacteroidetes bacterium GWF2_41_9]HAM10914.1 sulfate adenylyltransferase [Bacteroidales bacterium]
MLIDPKEKSKSLLRFTTAGSVDDGKSTLIGRLLYDSKSIFEDQMDHIVQSGKRLGREELDLSLLTDGLRAEREQGITIDVAYRYFATPARKFIIADTPGHIQYTRNMVTGASTADLAVILIDARKGVLEQTIRHSFIASLLDIRHIIFCVNKMDMINWSEEEFNKIVINLGKLVSKLGIRDAHYIPISAKYGDNVVDRSENMTWYHGKTFLKLIETIEIEKNKDPENKRFPVQTIIRPHTKEFHDYRGYAGRVAGGVFAPGDEVMVLPSMLRSKIKSIDMFGKTLSESIAGDSVSISLDDQIDISRGDMIVDPDDLPAISQDINLMVCWFNEQPLRIGAKYLLKINSNESGCIVKNVNYRLNIDTLEKDIENTTVRMNDIADITIKTSKPLFFDSYRKNNITGSMILIDEGTNETVAAGMII